jgi:hypothetical protein
VLSIVRAFCRGCLIRISPEFIHPVKPLVFFRCGLKQVHATGDGKSDLPVSSEEAAPRDVYFVATCKILQLCTSLILRFHSLVIPDAEQLFSNSNATPACSMPD